MKKSLALAYSMKKRAKKMAQGGMMTTDGYQSSCTEHCETPCTVHPQAEYKSEEYNKQHPEHTNSKASSEDSRKLNQHGAEEVGPEEGGQGFHEESYEGHHNDPHDEYQSEAKEEDMVGRIMRQRRQEFSEGGKVANETDIDTADHMPAQFDDLVLRDDLKENYTGANSGDELSNPGEDERRKDIVSRVMASRRKKDKLPNPA